MSSRNTYLSPDQQEQAAAISRALEAVLAAYQSGQREAGHLAEVFRAGLSSLAEAEVERFDILDADFARAFGVGEVVSTGSVCVAVRYAGVRLLDGIELP